MKPLQKFNRYLPRQKKMSNSGQSCRILKFFKNEMQVHNFLIIVIFLFLSSIKNNQKESSRVTPFLIIVIFTLIYNPALYTLSPFKTE